MTPDPGVAYWLIVTAIFLAVGWAGVAHHRWLRRSGGYADLDRVEGRASRLGPPRPLP